MAGTARIRAAPVSRAVTAAPGLHPDSSSALAKDPESPKTAEENRAMPRPEARKLRRAAGRRPGARRAAGMGRLLSGVKWAYGHDSTGRRCKESRWFLPLTL